jgi:hypothetical protein
MSAGLGDLADSRLAAALMAGGQLGRSPERNAESMYGLIFSALAICWALFALIPWLLLWCHTRSWTRNRKVPCRYPPMTVIAPQCGDINPPNIAALLDQDYPGTWEVIFVTRHDDPSWQQLTKYPKLNKRVSLLPAGDVFECARQGQKAVGQKNHNLLTALDVASADTEVYAFIDADARPTREWLRRLVETLTTNPKGAKAVTSARLYVPDAGLPSLVQSAWVLGSAAFLVGWWRYVWGGGFAVFKDAFQSAGVRKRWDGTEGFIANDDLNLTVAFRSRRYGTYFAPECLMLRFPPGRKESWRDALVFTNRQLLHVWWVRKDLWLTVIGMHGVKTLAIICALAVSPWQPTALLALVALLIDVANGWLTKTTLIRTSGSPATSFPAFGRVVLAFPLAACLSSLNALIAPFRRTMTWGAIVYRKRSIVGRASL